MTQLPPPMTKTLLALLVGGAMLNAGMDIAKLREGDAWDVTVFCFKVLLAGSMNMAACLTPAPKVPEPLGESDSKP